MIFFHVCVNSLCLSCQHEDSPHTQSCSKLPWKSLTSFSQHPTIQNLWDELEYRLWAGPRHPASMLDLVNAVVAEWERIPAADYYTIVLLLCNVCRFSPGGFFLGGVFFFSSSEESAPPTPTALRCVKLSTLRQHKSHRLGQFVLFLKYLHDLANSSWTAKCTVQGI